MSARLFVLALVAASAACAQMRLYAVDANGAEREATGLFDMGSSGPGDLLQTRFRARNTGTAAISLLDLRVAGQGFTVSGPSIPLNIAPGLAADIVVRFSATGSGSYSANLTVNALSLLLRATVTAAPVLTASGADVPAGTAIYLGRIQKGQKGLVPLTLENRGRDPLTIRAVTISGASFAYRGGSVPLTLAPGANQRFEIEFAPAANGSYTGTLHIDGRTFPLTGVGFDPPLPKPAILIEGTEASGQQPKLIVELAAVPESAGSGILRMDFRPLTATLPDDPAIRFLTGGARSINVQVREGERRVFFGGSSTLRDAAFQTGTTAGTLTLTLELSTHVETRTIQLQPLAPVIEAPTALRKTQDLEVALTGFDNTRSLSQALFTFYDGAGRPIAPGTIRADVRRDFEELFRSPSGLAGGTFSLRAAFPVQGGAASQVASVEVELVNSAGGGRTQRIVFQ